jgi:hypothetical protein
MSDKEDADKYRRLQAAALLKLFKQAHDGAEAESIQDVYEWVEASGLRTHPINPFNVLSEREIAETLKGGA